jgi:predicted transport protein
MPIYLNTNNKLKEVEERAFKLERDIQRVFEDNLDTIMQLTLVKSEFTIKDRRIDTLAYDAQTNAFVIIEYKRDKNISVFDQGITYLGLMLANKADFVIEYNEQLKMNMKRDDVDWTQSRVVFVSTTFSEYQIAAADFKDFSIELWEAKQFENNLIAINPIKKTKTAPSIKPVTQQSETYKRVTDEIKVYTEDEHFENANEEIAELYEKFRNAILNLSSDVEIKPQKFYIAFKKDGTNVACMEMQKKKLKIWIGAKFGKLEDGRGIAKDVANIGHYGTGDYEVVIDNDKDLEYIISLIKQVITD